MSFEGSYGARAIASTLAATTEANSGRVLNKNASFGSDKNSGQIYEMMRMWYPGTGWEHGYLTFLGFVGGHRDLCIASQ